MKYLEIDEETEKQLLAIFDAALKAVGIQALSVVNAVAAKVKEKDSCPPICEEGKSK